MPIGLLRLYGGEVTIVGVWPRDVYVLDDSVQGLVSERNSKPRILGEKLVVPSTRSESGLDARSTVSSVSSWFRRDVLVMGCRDERVSVGETGREAWGVLVTDARREPGAELARKRARSCGV